MKKRLSVILSLLFMLIACLHAQDYLISFTGSGESASVSTVKVENLTQGTNLTMNGSDVLHLMGTITGIESIKGDGADEVIIYPNPMDDYTRMKFALPGSSESVIALFDISGRKIAQIKEFLAKGEHTFNIQGVKEGIYFVRINSGKYSLSGRFISTGSDNRETKIEYENSADKENYSISQKEQDETKSMYSEIVMQYNDGDRLILTGISGDYSTVISDIPSSSKNVTFNFVSCTDMEGNNYPVVHIGSAKGESDLSDPASEKGVQIWMAENLRATKYNDGTDIPLEIDNTAWTNLTTPGYCWYNNSAEFKDVYGALYNWYAVGTGKLCPTGWHVPSDGEWHQLVLFCDPTALLGTYESMTAGKKLRETGTMHWNYYSEDITNETVFTALPGGRRYDELGNFSFLGDKGFWWSSTEVQGPSGSISAWHREMISGGGISRLNYGKKTGMSVRCVKD